MEMHALQCLLLVALIGLSSGFLDVNLADQDQIDTEAVTEEDDRPISYSNEEVNIERIKRSATQLNKRAVLSSAGGEQPPCGREARQAPSNPAGGGNRGPSPNSGSPPARPHAKREALQPSGIKHDTVKRQAPAPSYPDDGGHSGPSNSSGSTNNSGPPSRPHSKRDTKERPVPSDSNGSTNPQSGNEAGIKQDIVKRKAPSYTDGWTNPQNENQHKLDIVKRQVQNDPSGWTNPGNTNQADVKQDIVKRMAPSYPTGGSTTLNPNKGPPSAQPNLKRSLEKRQAPSNPAVTSAPGSTVTVRSTTRSPPAATTRPGVQPPARPDGARQDGSGSGRSPSNPRLNRRSQESDDISDEFDDGLIDDGDEAVPPMSHEESDGSQGSSSEERIEYDSGEWSRRAKRDAVHFTSEEGVDHSEEARERASGRTTAPPPVVPRNSPNSLKPIIGVVSQDITSASMQSLAGDRYKSYIPASSVKFLESAGARVAPILMNRSDAYYDQLFSKINGILVPGGGGAGYFQSNYARTIRYLLQKATTANDARDSFPMFFIDSGFEILICSIARSNIFTRCDGYDVALSLQPNPDAIRNGRMLRGLPPRISGPLYGEKETPHMHRNCLTNQNFTAHNLQDRLRILTTSKDSSGLEFISTIEYRNYPFYATHWHPELNAFEWNLRQVALSHSRSSIEIGWYFAGFFVNEARKSAHRFANVSDERKSLIYNFNPSYTDLVGSELVQAYLFR